MDFIYLVCGPRQLIGVKRKKNVFGRQDEFGLLADSLTRGPRVLPHESHACSRAPGESAPLRVGQESSASGSLLAPGPLLAIMPPFQHQPRSFLARSTNQPRADKRLANTSLDSAASHPSQSEPINPSLCDKNHLTNHRTIFYIILDVGVCACCARTPITTAPSSGHKRRASINNNHCDSGSWAGPSQSQPILSLATHSRPVIWCSGGQIEQSASLISSFPHEEQRAQQPVIGGRSSWCLVKVH